MYETGNFDAYEAVVMEYFDRCYTYARIFLAADEKIASAAGEWFGELTTIGENDGYTYMLAAYDVTVNEKDDPAIVEAAGVRVDEMLKTIQYQPVVIPEEEWADEPETVVPNAFPAFNTQDLSGNTVENSIFANADLTVLNIWSTTCFPCVSEMPELQKWSETMPENVQLIGLVLDVYSGNGEAIEMARMICEATGVNFPNLILSEEMIEFANGIIFTPTTIFVDGNGAIVGEPITGAMVDAYKAFVEEYSNAQ
jgi:thiol-disulfide isomerase/thioredoxin